MERPLDVDKFSPELSILVATRNQALKLVKTLPELVRAAQAVEPRFELIVIDDASMDDTPLVGAGWERRDPRVRVVRNARPCGRGYSLRRGVLACRGRYVFFPEQDVPVPHGVCARFLEALKEDPVVAGIRQPLDESLWRRWMRRSSDAFVRGLLVLASRGFDQATKACRRHVALETVSRAQLSGAGFDLEFLYIAQRLGYSIREIPLEPTDPERSPSRACLTDALKIRYLHKALTPELVASVPTGDASRVD